MKRLSRRGTSPGWHLCGSQDRATSVFREGGPAILPGTASDTYARLPIGLVFRAGPARRPGVYHISYRWRESVAW